MSPSGKIKQIEPGKQYGQWTVLSYSHVSENTGKNAYWLCRCSCGRECFVQGSLMRTGKSTKCRSCASVISGRRGLYSQNKTDSVYFIRCENYVKIGASKDVERRFKDLEGSNPFPLELLHVDEDEEFWHNIFAHRLHRGEWYYFEQRGGSCEL